jgi:predicted transcriptional regulator
MNTVLSVGDLSWPMSPGRELELAAQGAVMIPSAPLIAGVSRPLGYVIKKNQEMGVVGEERNGANISLSCFTRHLPAEDGNRRHVKPEGASGAGKTTLIKIVLDPFWHDVEYYTRFTGPGLERRGESLDGKILYIEQLEGNEPDQLKYLMTGGKLRILRANRDRSGKVIDTAYDQLPGEPVVISTQVGMAVDPQLGNRFSSLEIDESEEQTARIIHSKLEHWVNVRGDYGESACAQIQLIDKCCKLLGQHVKEVKIPFAMQLEQSLPKALSMRRGTDQLTSLINADAFMNAALGFRPLVLLKKQVGRYVYVVALPEDLNDALYILGDAFSDSLTGFLERARQVYEALQKNGGGTSRDIAKILMLSQNRAREYLNHLVEQDHATKTYEDGTYRYEAKPHNTPKLKLQASFTETDLQHWFETQFPNNTADIIIPPDAKTGFKSCSAAQTGVGGI